MKELLVCLSILITSAAAASISHGTQSAGVKGILMCNGKPAANVKVKLYDDDRGVDTDDLLEADKTDSNGYFELQGYTDEVTIIDPKLNIYHDCEDGLMSCQRKITIHISDSYISLGKKVRKIYDAGTIQSTRIKAFSETIEQMRYENSWSYLESKKERSSTGQDYGERLLSEWSKLWTTTA